MTAEARQHAARVAAKAELLSISLVELCARIDDGLMASEAPVLPDIDAEVEASREAQSLHYRANYTVALTHDKQRAATINCTFIAQYQLPADFEADDSEYEAYGATTVMFALHPFARELVQAMTMRLSLPPVTLGVLRLPMVLPTIDRAELDAALAAAAEPAVEPSPGR